MRSIPRYGRNLALMLSFVFPVGNVEAEESIEAYHSALQKLMADGQKENHDERSLNDLRTRVLNLDKTSDKMLERCSEHFKKLNQLEDDIRNHRVDADRGIRQRTEMLKVSEYCRYINSAVPQLKNYGEAINKEQAIRALPHRIPVLFEAMKADLPDIENVSELASLYSNISSMGGWGAVAEKGGKLLPPQQEALANLRVGIGKWLSNLENRAQSGKEDNVVYETSTRLLQIIKSSCYVPPRQPHPVCDVKDEWQDAAYLLELIKLAPEERSQAEDLPRFVYKKDQLAALASTFKDRSRAYTLLSFSGSRGSIETYCKLSEVLEELVVMGVPREHIVVDANLRSELQLPKWLQISDRGKKGYIGIYVAPRNVDAISSDSLCERAKNTLSPTPPKFYQAEGPKKIEKISWLNPIILEQERADAQANADKYYADLVSLLADEKINEAKPIADRLALIQAENEKAARGVGMYQQAAEAAEIEKNTIEVVDGELADFFMMLDRVTPMYVNKKVLMRQGRDVQQRVKQYDTTWKKEGCREYNRVIKEYGKDMTRKVVEKHCKELWDETTIPQGLMGGVDEFTLKDCHNSLKQLPCWRK